jgi:hypothetical protein
LKSIGFPNGVAERQAFQRLVLRMESAVLRRFDSVSSICRMVERLSKGIEVTWTRYFPNWVDISRINHR